MADAVGNQDTEIMAKGSGVFNQAGSLVSQVQRMYSQPAFQRSLPTMVQLLWASLDWRPTYTCRNLIGLPFMLVCLSQKNP